jgi:hypothetical protein
MALGVPGPAGEAGEPGANGVGVPVGGTTGQVLAKIDGTNYNTEWIDAGAAGDYLPLAGGTLTGNLIIDTGSGSQGNYETTEMFVTRTDATGTSANAYGALYNGGLEIGDSNGLWAEFTTAHLRFSDGSTQASAYNPDVLNGYLPLSGGTISSEDGMSGIIAINTDDNTSTGFNAYGISLYEAGWNVNLSRYGLTFDGGVGYPTAYRYDGITFPDSTFQTTAFPPTGGTTSQYITGTGSLVTFPPVGDRYLTSSTSTLTCDSGNGKTMTVGTGLSYSRQQDITVSYSNSIHMHGTVLTYDSVTGVMTFDSNTHSGSGTYSNWEVNVGGVAGAILPVGGTSGQVLAKINSTNFNTEWVSLGTMSTEPATAYLSTASAVANYLTISNASATYLTQSSASSTYIAQSSFATTAQAQAGTSTTTVVSPATLLDAKVFAGYKPLSMVYTWTSAVSGAGATTTANGQSKNVFAPTSATGSAMIYIFNYASSRGQQSASGADFTKRTTIGGRFIKTTTTADANSVFRFLLGKGVPSPAAGDLAVRGIGFRQVANGALELQVHNGTSLFNVSSTFTPTANQSYDVVIVADAGTATMFVNGSSVATSSNAPTALLGTNVGILEVETQNTSTLSGSAMNYACSDMFAQTNL